MIPVLFAIAALVFFRKKVALWEPIIPMVVTVLFIIFFKWIGVESLTKDTEYWGNHVTYIHDYQEWDEWIEQQCPYDCNCTTDEDGTQTCQTCWEDCSYCKNHPRHWTKELNDGSEIEISYAEYSRLKTKFKSTDVFVDMHRDFHRIDGDMIQTEFLGGINEFEFYASAHNYENKIQASTSIFNYPDIDSNEIKQFKLYDYPKVTADNRLPAILFPKAINVNVADQREFNYLNGMLGMTKEIRVWVLLYETSNQRAAFMQEAYWKNGNTNELVICIGVNKDKTISWTKIFGWAKDKTINVETRDYILSQKKLDLISLGKWLYKEVPAKWKRTSFDEFEYLEIKPPSWCVWTTWIVSIISCILLYFWIITNQFTASDINGDGNDEFNTNDKVGANFFKRISKWAERTRMRSKRIKK
jgi:hypothetical protein